MCMTHYVGPFRTYYPKSQNLMHFKQLCVIPMVRELYVNFFIFSSACIYTAELLSWCGHLSWRGRLSMCPSSVRKLRFLRNRCMNPDQILKESTYPPDHCFLFFQNFMKFSVFSFSLTWEPMGSKRYSSHKSLLKFLKIVLNFCLQYPHKVTFCGYFNFAILNFNDFFFRFP